MIGTNYNYQLAGGQRQDGVQAAIAQASAKTGVDFNYLVKQASVESSMNPNAKARTSSATGLYQFVEQTWLQMVKSHGTDHGYGKYSNAISVDSRGNYHVANRAMRNEVLNLRRDPRAASLMAAELACDNNDYLQSKMGIAPNSTDLYMAHFMGAGGATNFLKAMNKNPNATAANLFPEAARSNKGVFYQNGKALSLQQVYNRFNSKFDGTSAPIQTADNNTSNINVVLPAASSWSNPNSIAARRIENMATHAQNSLLSFVSNADSTPSRSMFDVVLRAQESMRFAHDDNNRYNA